jgi:hypothetical protein
VLQWRRLQLHETTETQHAFETYEADWLNELASARIAAKNAADASAIEKSASLKLSCLTVTYFNSFKIKPLQSITYLPVLVRVSRFDAVKIVCHR